MQEKVCGSCKRVFKEEKDFLENTSQWRVCSAENLWFNCSCGSTLMLPKGKFDWYSPTLGMGSEAASIFNKIGGMQELPHIPSAVMHIQKMLLDSQVETSELAKAVKKDPFLASETIRVAENLRRVRQVVSKEGPSLEYAITFIGRRHLANLVMAASIKAFKLNVKIFNSQDFWDQAFLTAALSEVIATQYSKKIERDKAYLAGSLCNIGKVVGAIVYPDKTDSTAQITNDLATQCTWINAEHQTNLPDHCLLGEIGAAFWGMPDFVSAAIKYHHSPHKAVNTADKELSHIVAFANMLSHWIRLEPHRIDQDLLEMETKHFQLDKKDLENFATKMSVSLKAA